MKKRFGFTLAEVLITLGIIGVVAAMTIPTLIANTNSARFRSQFKKSISTLSQAGLMAQAQYDIDYSTPTTECASLTDDPESTYTMCSIFNGTLSGHVLTATKPNQKNGKPYSAKIEYSAANLVPAASNTPTTLFGLPAYADDDDDDDDGGNASGVLYLSLADGSLVVFKGTMHGCHKQLDGKVYGTDCVGFIDVNGTTLPNKEVSCDTSSNTTPQTTPTTLLGLPAYAEGEGENGGTTGSTGVTVPQTTCAVPNDANHMTDIFPIIFHDATVEPVTPAGRYILTTSK